MPATRRVSDKGVEREAFNRVEVNHPDRESDVEFTWILIIQTFNFSGFLISSASKTALPQTAVQTSDGALSVQRVFLPTGLGSANRTRT
jgi:hypothetical protein